MRIVSTLTTESTWESPLCFGPMTADALLHISDEAEDLTGDSISYLKRSNRSNSKCPNVFRNTTDIAKTRVTPHKLPDAATPQTL